MTNQIEGSSKRARALRALRPRVVRKVFARAVAFEAKQSGNSRVRPHGLTQAGLVKFVQSAPAFGGHINAESKIDEDEPLDARTWEVLDRAFRGAVVDMAESTAQFGWRNVAAVGAAASDSDTDANEFNGSTAVDGVNNAIRTHFSTLCVQASLKHAWKKSPNTEKCIMAEARALACQSDVELSIRADRLVAALLLRQAQSTELHEPERERYEIIIHSAGQLVSISSMAQMEKVAHHLWRVCERAVQRHALV